MSVARDLVTTTEQCCRSACSSFCSPSQNRLQSNTKSALRNSSHTMDLRLSLDAYAMEYTQWWNAFH